MVAAKRGEREAGFMISALIAALAMMGFGLLVFGERMGFAAGFAAYGVIVTFLLAFVAIAFASATSRLGRYVIGATRGGGVGLAVLVACLLIFALPLAFEFGHSRQSGAVALLLGFFAAQIMAPFNPWQRFRHSLDTGSGAGNGASTVIAGTSIVGLAMSGAALMLVLYAFPLTIRRFADSSGWDRDLAFRIALAITGFAVLLGGMVALARGARVLIAVAMVFMLLPFAIDRMGLLAGYLDGVLVKASLEQVSEGISLRIPAVFPTPDWPVVILGFALGLVAFQPAASIDSRAVRVVALLAGVVMALGLSAITLEHAAGLEALITNGLQRVPPAQWPVFVFDEGLRGWLKACTHMPDDAIAAARACGMPTANTVLPPGSLAFDGGLASPALALSQGWPIILGFIWGLLPPIVELMAMGFLLLAAATGIAEGVFVGWMHPKALRTLRLALGRLTLLGVLVILAQIDRHELRVEGPLFRWLLLGLALTALTAMIAGRLVWLTRALRAMKAPASPVATEGSLPDVG